LRVAGPVDRSAQVVAGGRPVAVQQGSFICVVAGYPADDLPEAPDVVQIAASHNVGSGLRERAAVVATQPCPRRVTRRSGTHRIEGGLAPSVLDLPVALGWWGVVHRPRPDRMSADVPVAVVLRAGGWPPCRIGRHVVGV